MAACNFYSDSSRLLPCQLASGQVTGEDASKVYDGVIKLTGVYHIMEWLRMTVLLTIVFVKAPFMMFWYCTTLSSLFGLAVGIQLHMVYFSAEGKACSTQ